MKIGVIKTLAGEHSVRQLCRTLDVTRSAYYATKRRPGRPRARANARLGVKLGELFEASGRTYGSPRLTMALRRAGENCGRRRVARLMRVRGLRARQKRRFRPRTTDSRHLCPIAPNRLAGRTEPPAQPNEVWQADITYVATREGWLYVAGVLDACSRKIVGWAADDAMPAGLVARAFERAVASQRPAAGLLHHSDRGSQYASDVYRELLRRHGVVASMSRPGNCYDNAKMENFWATLKTELIDGRVFASRAEAKSEIFRYIEVFYNRVRLHGALGYHSPVDFAKDPTLVEALEALVEPFSRGDPMRPLRWTCKSVRRLASELQARHHAIGPAKVAELLSELAYSLQSHLKRDEGKGHAERDAQFVFHQRAGAGLPGGGRTRYQRGHQEEGTRGDLSQGRARRAAPRPTRGGKGLRLYRSCLGQGHSLRRL